MLTTATRSRSSRLGWLIRATVLIATVAASAAALKPLLDKSVGVGTLSVAVTTAFVAIGLLLSRQPEQRGNAALFAASGILWTVSWLNEWNRGVLPLLSVPGLAFVAFGACAFLRYPDVRLTSAADRWFVRALSWCIAATCVIPTLLSRPQWHDFPAGSVWPTVVANRSAYDIASTITEIGLVALALAYPPLLQRRYRRLRALDRNIAGPVLIGAMVTAAGTGSVVVASLLSALHGYGIYYVEVCCLLVTPIVFLIAIARRQMAFRSLGKLSTTLTGASTSDQVRDALRSALDDPSLEILYWVPQVPGYVDATGSLAPDRPGGRIMVPVDGADGTPFVLVSVDENLARHQPLVQAAVATCGLALHNARLQAELAAHVEQLRESSARIVEAGVVERRRIERNLHDGAQQRLIALKVALSARERATTDPVAVAALRYAREQLSQSLDELRELASGIHPAVLSQSGLAAAVEALTEVLPLRVELDIVVGDLPETVESTAYYLICEAVTNVVKHTDADWARVSVRHGPAGVQVDVSDNGGGGADINRGTGLRGLRDRTVALGGRLAVQSPAGDGTTISAELPCG